ncbi:MAG: hypothetical protein HZB37_08370 [Planctomycetes bacterium]|nr:hypothetical protein [Planctomycetota bacterium]
MSRFYQKAHIFKKAKQELLIQARSQRWTDCAKQTLRRQPLCSEKVYNTNFTGSFFCYCSKYSFNLKDTIRVVTKRTQGINLKAVIGNINPVIRGHVNYFRLGNVRTVYHSWDMWMRMRLRCFKFSRKWKTDNRRFLTHRFFKMGVLSFEREFLKKYART